jgi:hypothetical protein
MGGRRGYNVQLHARGGVCYCTRVAKATDTLAGQAFLASEAVLMHIFLRHDVVETMLQCSRTRCAIVSGAFAWPIAERPIPRSVGHAITNALHGRKPKPQARGFVCVLFKHSYYVSVGNV